MKLSYAQYQALHLVNENKLFSGKRVSLATIGALVKKGLIEYREVKLSGFTGGGYFTTKKGDAHL